MPEATILYVVAAVVAAGLVVWVAWVLKSEKEPWARRPLDPSPVAVPPEAPPSLDEPPRSNPDSTSRATPRALSEGRAKASEEVPGDPSN